MKKRFYWFCTVITAVAMLLATGGCLLDSMGTGTASYSQPELLGNYVLDPEDTTTNAISIMYEVGGNFYCGIGWGLDVTDIPWGFTGKIHPRGEYNIDIGLQFESVGSDGSRLGDEIVEGTILYTPPEDGGVVDEIHFRLSTDDAATFVLVRVPDSD